MEANVSLTEAWKPTTIGFLFSVDNRFVGWEAYAFAAVTANLAFFTVRLPKKENYHNAGVLWV